MKKYLSILLCVKNPGVYVSVSILFLKNLLLLLLIRYALVLEVEVEFCVWNIK
jgi:hypothetical protein